MPRDSNGNFSLDPKYLAVTGQDITVSQHNPVLEDIASALTGSLPRNGSAPMGANLPFGGFKATGMAAGTAPTDGATKAQVDAASPIGILADWAGATAPVNWLLCYGQAVSRTDYAALFAVCGTTYGAGDGSTTFNVPDLRGRVTAGKDDMGGTDAARLPATGALRGTTLGYVGGSDRHVLTINETPAHDHGGLTSTNGDHSHTYTTATKRNDSNAGSSPSGWSGEGGASTGAAGSHQHSISSQGGGAFHNNVQPTIILTKIIKAL